MKKLFRNVNVAGVIMILFATVVLFTQSAFKSENNRRVSYYFNGADASEINTVGSWDNTLNEDDYDCVETSPLPCQITIPPGYTLSTYLSSFDAAYITSHADSRRVEAE